MASSRPRSLTQPHIHRCLPVGGYAARPATQLLYHAGVRHRTPVPCLVSPAYQVHAIGRLTPWRRFATSLPMGAVLALISGRTITTSACFSGVADMTACDMRTLFFERLLVARAQSGYLMT